MTYLPILIKRLDRVPLGRSIRTIGVVVKHKDSYYLRDPFGDQIVRLRRVDKLPEGELIEVFGTLTAGGIFVDFFLTDVMRKAAKKYVIVVERERQELFWINERGS